MSTPALATRSRRTGWSLIMTSPPATEPAPYTAMMNPQLIAPPRL
jgi:hypothetical protein